MKNLALVLLFILSTSLSAACFKTDEITNNELKAKLDALLESKFENSKIPAMSILIGNSSNIVYQNNFGLIGDKKPNKDSLYDIASITKLFTATTILKIMEDKGITVQSKIYPYLDDFRFNLAKKKITFEDLLRHKSGFKPGVYAPNLTGSTQENWNHILNILPNRTHNKTLYSDLNFLYLGKLIEKLSDKSLALSHEDNLFNAIPMLNTKFSPGVECIKNCAQTSDEAAGIVHDPTAKKLSNQAGHAGLFSTTHDLARFAALFLNKGLSCEGEVLSISQVDAMTKKMYGTSRGLGFDISSGYSNRPRGAFTKYKSFGHTGFTGTSLWIDPTKDTFVIVLTNAVKSTEAKKNFLRLNKEISTLVGTYF